LVCGFLKPYHGLLVVIAEDQIAKLVLAFGITLLGGLTKPFCSTLIVVLLMHEIHELGIRAPLFISGPTGALDLPEASRLQQLHILSRRPGLDGMTLLHRAFVGQEA
jgi:hypothetical protein